MSGRVVAGTKEWGGMVELRERPTLEVMRAEEKMKTWLPIKIATRSHRLGVAVKGMGE